MCLQFMIMRYVDVPDINSLYELFNNRKKALQLLKTHYLDKAVKKVYNDDPLTYLHESLHPKERSEFLYYNYLYMNYCDENYEKIEKELSDNNDQEE